MVSSLHVEPVSRSDQYKKVMKPLLERKRRARINRCLDELRDLLVSVLQSEGEAVTRLEKADILELTVRHVRRLSQRRRLALPLPGAKQQQDREDVAKFQQGFVAAAQQVQSFLMATNSLEPTVSTRLLTHLSSYATSITPPTNASMVSPQSPSASPAHPPPPHHPQNQPQAAAPVPIRPPAPPVPIVQPLVNKSPSSPTSPQLSFAVPTVPQQPVVSQSSNQQHKRMLGSSNLTSFYSIQRKESSYSQQPLIDLSNRQAQNSQITVRDIQCQDRKVAPSPFIDVVSTENDFPQLKPPQRSPLPSNGPLIKSEPVTAPSTPRSPCSNEYDLSQIRLQIQAKVASMAVSETQARMHPIRLRQGENNSTEGGQKRPHSPWSPPQERSSSPYPQDLSMKKYEDGQSSWRPW